MHKIKEKKSVYTYIDAGVLRLCSSFVLFLCVGEYIFIFGVYNIDEHINVICACVLTWKKNEKKTLLNVKLNILSQKGKIKISLNTKSIRGSSYIL